MATFFVIWEQKLILLTTSRRPTERIRTLSRELVHSIPSVIRINRGKISKDGLAEKAIDLKADRVIIIDRWKDGSGKINLFEISSMGLTPVAPIIMLSKINLRREIKKGYRGKYSSIISVESNIPELDRLSKSLSQFFRLPVIELDKIGNECHVSMHFSLDSKKHLQTTFIVLNQMVEIGPRLTISRLIWEDSK